MFTLFKNGTLIDGNGGDPIKDAAVLIEDNYIKTVGKATDVAVPKSEVNVIDAEGGFILPGFFDMHVHLLVEPCSPAQALRNPFSLKFYQSVHHMKSLLDAGVTSVRDAGYTDAGVREAVNKGLVQGPRMEVSVTALTSTGGHGDSWMPSGLDVTMPFMMSYPTLPDGICNGISEVRQKVREVIRDGADIVKVHATGGVMSPTDTPQFTEFTLEELKAIVEEADLRGRKVMAHAQGNLGIKYCTRAGVHSIEHGIYLDDETIELMLKCGTYLVPTLLAAVSAARDVEHMPKYSIEKAKEVVEIHHESIAKAYQAGVKIAMGTDSGVMPHGENLQELGLMCDIGMSPMESIVASTKTAAECMEWDDKLGTVEAGKLADIVILSKDPLADIHVVEDTNNVITVMKDGKVLKDIRKVTGVFENRESVIVQ
ncbi:metal-dependent hydrolase family protein [Sporolactobacillus putidus]|uniref:Aryldialkylphosphatase n=1 Tax=Sporolactobacillus putidus TaxID=492735 RepID=A0A917S401_9BACL|nr:amidohydrolase family protein [Sporolactobacillus putidus]GGL56865.1 aryldialkylphosphatase [Sporolactobacillus putidus]